jgi:CDP-diacylglycerol--glycerol-3-phosphate 3-phosphatidyltransferase
MILVAHVKIMNIALVLIHRKKLISIHSALNKITGFALFLLPLTLTFVKPADSVAIICALATIAVMQEVYLIANGKEVV